MKRISKHEKRVAELEFAIRDALEVLRAHEGIDMADSAIFSALMFPFAYKLIQGIAEKRPEHGKTLRS